MGHKREICWQFLGKGLEITLMLELQKVKNGVNDIKNGIRNQKPIYQNSTTKSLYTNIEQIKVEENYNSFSGSMICLDSKILYMEKHKGDNMKTK